MFTGVYTSYRNFGSSDPFALKLTSYNKDRPEVLHIYLHAKRPTQSWDFYDQKSKYVCEIPLLIYVG